MIKKLFLIDVIRRSSHGQTIKIAIVTTLKLKQTKKEMNSAKNSKTLLFNNV